VTKKTALWSVGIVAAAAVAGLACGSMSDVSAPAAESSAGGESITNNQEAGVDEGGIVKAWGDYLIVLRRGRLFTVRVGKMDLSPVCRVDAYPDDDLGTWYDEMLVHDRTVVVIGYSYSVGATEVGLFDLDPQGCISHRSTHFLRSNDYYSSRNYASRLVDGKLVFYMPHGVAAGETDPDTLLASSPPAVRRFRSNTWRRVIAPVDVHVPERPRGSAALHTVVTCDLSRRDMDCTAQAMLGAYGRTFYVSPRAVYVWVHDGYGADEQGSPGGVAYRLPFGQEPPGALRVWGVPTDQFSFKERDGKLHVLVRSQGGGDWMADAERSRDGAVALAQIPVRAFAGEIGSASPGHYTDLPAPEGGGHAFQNRFVGDHVLYGTGTTWGYAERGTRSHLYAHPYARQGGSATIALTHGVDRIEALGEDAVVIGSDGDNLTFSSIDLSDRPHAAGRFVLPGASQGETRSHGFFYHPDPQSERHGILGLPVRRGGPGWSHLVHGSAEMLFLGVDALALQRMGRLVARDDQVDDECELSCVDWYGNARPIFYRGRVFALLGYELVEGIVRRGRIVEVDRVHLIGDLPR
jgi:hypothetical protein